MIWSFGLACLDVYAIRRRSDLQSPVLLSLFAVGDWVLNFYHSSKQTELQSPTLLRASCVNSTGHCTSLSCSCVFICRSYGFIHKRHCILQAGLSLLQLVSVFCRFSFLQLGFGCYIVSCNVLDLDMTLKLNTQPTPPLQRSVSMNRFFFLFSFDLTHNRKLREMVQSFLVNAQDN